VTILTALIRLLWLAIACCAIGCHSAVEQSSEAAPVAEAPATPNSSPEDSATKPSAEPELADAQESPSAVAAFTPPFPDRLELFEPPKRAQGNVRRDDEHGETVELKGFINVDQPRVILAIDGQISPFSEGSERYGVRVISIQPPSVVLQRGRSRWTATLE
jgi:hypothetical protein